MIRKNALKIHVYVATFLAPIMLMIAISGGLYLLGFKGNVTQTKIELNNPAFDITADDLEQQVRTLFSNNNIDADFEYIKQSGSTLYTRPTSKLHYMIKATDSSVSLTKVEPDLVKSIVELHKGHGPTAFKTLQKVTAAGLIIILITGMLIGVLNRKNRKTALISIAAGSLVFIVLAM